MSMAVYSVAAPKAGKKRKCQITAINLLKVRVWYNI